MIAGLSAGADDFMTKPFDCQELRMRVRAAVRILGIETRDLTIFTLAKSVEARDAHSGRHLERGRRYPPSATLLERRLHTSSTLGSCGIRLCPARVGLGLAASLHLGHAVSQHLQHR